MRNDKDDVTVKARKAVDQIWNRANLHGRCWGPKTKGNQFAGTNITIAIGDEIVSISKNGHNLAVHEFKKTKRTKLGAEIKRVLKKKNLRF